MDLLRNLVDRARTALALQPRQPDEFVEFLDNERRAEEWREHALECAQDKFNRRAFQELHTRLVMEQKALKALLEKDIPRRKRRIDTLQSELERYRKVING